MEMKENILEKKSYQFALKIISLYKKLIVDKEYVLSKQLLKSGTAIGANVAEANGAISTADFSAKISIAYKESLECKYWLKLLNDSDYISAEDFQNVYEQSDELSRILYSILKKTRINQ